MNELNPGRRTIPPSCPTTLARRCLIEVLGSGAVLAALPLASGCVSGGMPPIAVEAWKPSAPADVPRFVLAHALLAPNPHKRQPCLADLRHEDEITLVLDKDRLLPETDPFGRQIWVGCGAFDMNSRPDLGRSRPRAVKRAVKRAVNADRRTRRECADWCVRFSLLSGQAAAPPSWHSSRAPALRARRAAQWSWMLSGQSGVGLGQAPRLARRSSRTAQQPSLAQ